MEFLFEFIFQLLGELLLQIATEALFEGGLDLLRDMLHRRVNRWLAALGYALSGAAAGGISLLIFPHAMVQDHAAQMSSVLAIPLLCGATMAVFSGRRGGWRAERQAAARFLYAFLFALGMTLVRFRLLNGA